MFVGVIVLKRCSERRVMRIFRVLFVIVSMRFLVISNCRMCLWLLFSVVCIVSLWWCDESWVKSRLV